MPGGAGSDVAECFQEDLHQSVDYHARLLAGTRFCPSFHMNADTFENRCNGGKLTFGDPLPGLCSSSLKMTRVWQNGDSSPLHSEIRNRALFVGRVPTSARSGRDGKKGRRAGPKTRRGWGKEDLLILGIAFQHEERQLPFEVELQIT
jgi:hypothetical protein